MAEPQLTDVFGPGATQTATTLTISKADLATVGLSASATNSAESLVVALLLLAQKYLSDENQALNPDIQITITQSFDSLVTRNNTTYRQRSYSIEMQRPDASAAINPNDY
ncbi:hypothetical protein [Scytonema sp. PCC 10023]|uniref:hypothetical protein n=1 Tax=Scytonema sp. PCC 10023 TaxID=1680591 RepID=UPI0039C632CD